MLGPSEECHTKEVSNHVSLTPEIPKALAQVPYPCHLRKDADLSFGSLR